jgi:hypothetical protein
VPIISEYVTKAKKKGIGNAQEIVDYIVKTLDELQ